MAKEKKKTIDAVIGQPVQITLQSMAGSTGYSWFLSKLTGGLYLAGVSVVPGQDPSGGAIAPVNQVFEFLAAEKGKFEVEFKLIAPWRAEETADTEVYVINITEPKKTAADDIEAAMKGRDFINASAVNVGDCTNVIYAAPMSQPVVKYAAPMSQTVLKYAAPMSQTVLKYAAPMSQPVLKYAAPMSQPVLKYAAPMALSTMVAYAAPVDTSTLCATDPCLTAGAADPCLTMSADPCLTPATTDPCLTREGQMAASTMIAYAAPVTATDPCLAQCPPVQTLYAAPMPRPFPLYAAPLSQASAAGGMCGQPQPLYAAPMAQPQPLYAAPMAASAALYAAPMVQPRPLYAAPMIQPYAAPFTTYCC